MEQYRIAVEMADRVSARRTTANSLFATIHTGLIVIFASVFLSPDLITSKARPEPAALFALTVVGVLLAATWFLLIRSYRDLNAAKFRVIQEMERQLPAAPLTDEWQILNRDPVPFWRGRYAELNALERVVPVVLAGLYVAASLWAGLN